MGRPVTPFEMRNELILKSYGQTICDFNHNPPANKWLEEYKPKTKIHIDEIIHEWATNIKSKLPSWREKLGEFPERIKVIDEIDEILLFPGFEDHFSNLVPREPDNIVLAHNDVQANNILTLFLDYEKIKLIDFEYSGWNPRAFDIANYCCEAAFDNSYPLDLGISYYLNNLPNDHE